MILKSRLILWTNYGIFRPFTNRAIATWVRLYYFMNKKSQFNKLLPILYVKDLEKEADFYKSFGWKVSYQGDEFPGFIGLRSGSIEFGLERKGNFDSNKADDILVWQMGVDNFSRIMQICKDKNIVFTEPKQYWPRMNAWEMTIHTPNGYILHLEKVAKD